MKDGDLEVLLPSAWLSESKRYIRGRQEIHHKGGETFRFRVADLQEKVKRMKYVCNLVK